MDAVDEILALFSYFVNVTGVDMIFIGVVVIDRHSIPGYRTIQR